jgi:exopolyphosphatase / guanosine-5'-triphosphate,3'-diphosphate pyrophosphatase
VPPGIVRPTGEDIVLLDFGSTAVRLALARVRLGIGYRILAETRLPTRIARPGMARLRPAAIRRALAAADRFIREVGNERRLRRLAIATAAVREAADSERLRGPLRERRIPLRILNAEEEGRLGALAAVRATRLGTALVADLGGGSLELTQTVAGCPRFVTSLPVGCVRLTARFLRHDPPTGRELTALRNEIRCQLAPVLASTAGERAAALVGLGGTVRTLAKMLGRDGARPPGRRVWLERHEVTAVRARLERLPWRRRRRLPGLRADRADVIVAGVVVVEELLILGGFGSLCVCRHGVRHGVLLEETFGRRHSG